MYMHILCEQIYQDNMSNEVQKWAFGTPDIRDARFYNAVQCDAQR